MKRFLRLNRENITYLGLWLLLFLSPLLSMCIKAESGLVKAFSWMEVFHVWKFFVVYLVMFLVHNFVLAPCCSTSIGRRCILPPHFVW